MCAQGVEKVNPNFAPEAVNAYMMENAPLWLAFDPDADFGWWRERVDAKLRELLGQMPPRVSLNIQIEYEKEHEDFYETRFTFTSEPYAEVPCHLLIPKAGEGPFPVVITVQGHSSGMHISLARPKSEADKESISGGDRDFAIRTIKEGYAALVMEQRAFGEREDQRPEALRGRGDRCTHPSMVALLLGRTMIGQRSWDVVRAIDVLETFDQVDADKVGLMGNSGGGTTTYFASCIDERIKVSMPSCYVCTFRDSIGSIDHCPDNYIPGVLNWFEMGDLAGLIAPRPLIVVAGKEDGIFPFHAVQETFETIKAIYAAAGAPDNCRLVAGEGGHRFYADQAWPVFHELSGWKK